MSNSWSGYVDNLMNTRRMTAVGIFGPDGTEWAKSDPFPLTQADIKLVIAGLSDSSKLTSGLTVNGERYIFVRSDPGVSLLLKKGAGGIIAYKSTQSTIILFNGSLLFEQSHKKVQYATVHSCDCFQNASQGSAHRDEDCNRSNRNRLRFQ